MISASIIIPYKKNIKYIFETLDSIKRQSLKEFEIILVYDDEDLKDFEKIQVYMNNNFGRFKNYKIIINKKNLGAGRSRNKGIHFAKGKYIAFIDSDDVWEVSKLKDQINFMKENNLKISHTSYFIINENSKKISARTAKKKLTYNELILSCDIGLSTVMIERDFLILHSLKFPKIATKEDYVLWLRIIILVRKIQGLDKQLTSYRKRKNSLSSNLKTSLINGYLVYRKYMGFSVFKSLFYLFLLSLNFLKKKIIDDLYNNYQF